MKPVALVLLALALTLLLPTAPGALAGDPVGPGGPPGGGRRGPPTERERAAMRDLVGGVPRSILELQSRETIVVPSLAAACSDAGAAALEVAEPLIDATWHTGAHLEVPGDYPTIQAAIDAAKPRDTVVVGAGTWYELIRMKDGVRLVSDDADGGNEAAVVEGAVLLLPRRTLRTILDGSKARASRHGMIDFEPGTGRHTVVDGFTLQNLPAQNHHMPGHAHAVNVRGASPVLMNCLIQDNGSTGIGSHVVFKDQGTPMPQRDFRHANIAHEASAVLFHNIVRHNVGLGIGCNHFSTPLILGNEVLGNDDSNLAAQHGEETGPGMGIKHGAAPLIVGNLVHDNAGGGILSKFGAPQGRNPIDRRTSPTVRGNVIWKNGKKKPALSANGVGTTERPVVFEGNRVFDAPKTGIALSGGAVGIVEKNLVVQSAMQGIVIHGATALRLNGNQVTGAHAPGFIIAGGAHVLEMKGNAAEDVRGPRFMLRGSTIGPKTNGENSD